LASFRSREGLLDGQDLGARVVCRTQHGEHPPAEVEERVFRVLLAEADWALAGLEVPHRLEDALDIGHTWRATPR
jgi:hypothetical protein